jgi:hypothetical protein
MRGPVDTEAGLEEVLEEKSSFVRKCQKHQLHPLICGTKRFGGSEIKSINLIFLLLQAK